MLTVKNGATTFGSVTYLGKNADSSGTITVDGAGSTFRSDQYLYVGDAGTGILNIANGAVAAASNSCSVVMANSVGSTGMVTVDGTGSTLASSVNIIVGNSGSGELNIAHGGLVTASASTVVANGTSSTGAIHFGDQGGTLTTGAFLGSAAQITGTGTISTHGLVTDETLVFDKSRGLDQTWAWTSDQKNVTVHLTADDSGNFNVMGAGYAGTGTLTIRDGMAINSGDQYLGRKPGSSGVATVDGTGSKWTGGGYLAVGYYGNGSLAVTNGGTVTARSAYVGELSGASGNLTVDGTSTIFSSITAFYVGDYGTGMMAITHGGTATCTPARLGNNTGSSGTVSVDGAGSTWVCGGSLTVGYSGAGVVNVTNGGAVSDSGPGYLGVNTGSSGLITVDGAGSKWTSGALTVGSSGGGTLSITNGGAVQSGGDSIGSAGKVTVDGVGSSWTDNGGLTINGAGGELNITNGGLVTVSGRHQSQRIDTFWRSWRDADGGDILGHAGAGHGHGNDRRPRFHCGRHGVNRHP
jgi:T5SS/PEP-CTERM-associated repeat protein